ncbi:hypothetical protein [Streptomyces globosus]|uniref:hypothetical protein n=1 Tax=Streptomyces globosus TaxID=68209 RepID=UPI0013B3E9D1|nr:hypothetical protein [Streptomyces globosus]
MAASTTRTRRTTTTPTQRCTRPPGARDDLPEGEQQPRPDRLGTGPPRGPPARLAKYADDPEADAAQRLGEAFTEDKVRRADAFLEASHQDADRLADIAARLGNDTATDEAWLVQQLATAWMRLDELRDRIDGGGSLMANTHVASAIDYVRGSRR